MHQHRPKPGVLKGAEDEKNPRRLLMRSGKDPLRERPATAGTGLFWGFGCSDEGKVLLPAKCARFLSVERSKHGLRLVPTPEGSDDVLSNRRLKVSRKQKMFPNGVWCPQISISTPFPAHVAVCNLFIFPLQHNVSVNLTSNSRSTAMPVVHFS